MDVAPSILSADFANLQKSIAEICDDVQYLHIDVMDGHFVPNITIGAPVIKALRKKTDLIFDTHLMISEPAKFIKDFYEAGSDYITIHYEASQPMEAIKLIKNYNVKAGISIKPNTNVDEIINYLPFVDLVLVMSVEPGFGGQKFMESAIEKVKKLKELQKNNHYKISVDGGINEHTAKLVYQAGADIVVAGNYIFKSENKKEAIRRIKCVR